MNLSNLKKQVPAKLYGRGLDYFEQDFVEQLTQDAPNRWHARVAGTRDYEVMVKLTGKESVEWTSCTCPFESDTLCKHEVAVCLAIRQYQKENPAADVDVLAQIKALKKAELLEILKELAEKQPAVQLYLTEKFSGTGAMDEHTARRTIRKSASRASRDGFIEWDRTDEALEGTERVMAYVDDLKPEQDAEKMIRLCLVIVDECNGMLEEADDSAGDISSMVYESLDKIDAAFADWPGEPDEAAVDRMLELFYPHIVTGLEQDMTDSPVSLLNSLMQWNKQGDFTGKLYDFIEKLLNSNEIQDMSYEKEQFRRNQLYMLQQKGDRDAVEAFYAEHRSYPEIRRAQTIEALIARDYERVLRLCHESERLDANFAGMESSWKKLRFSAYEGMGNTIGMIGLSKEFAAEGEEEYYDLLRSLVGPEKWPETLEALLAEMKKTLKGRPLYLKTLISEYRTGELLEFCRDNIAAIESFYVHLLADYPHEVNELYTTYIYRLIEPANNREAYRSACRKINGFRDAMGAEAAAGLIEELKFMYPKRRALLDELKKVEE